MIEAAHFILYVENQERSRAFYSAVLVQEPSLHVPGMTEFRLHGGNVLGLMPADAIRRLLEGRLPDPARGHGIPRAELYLYVEDPEAYHRRALAEGARQLSPLQKRSWGDVAAYSLDADGHVLAFARRGALR
jgi:uncharacterized glyoxalase superfamily protein PhnB